MYTDEYGVQYVDETKQRIMDIPNDFEGKFAIPESVTDIYSGAFSGCTKLTTIYIPRSVSDEMLNYGTFSECESVEAFEVEEGHPTLCTVDGVLFNKDMTWILRYPAAKQGHVYTIPESVIGIEWSAFAYSSLESIRIPESVKSIMPHAFSCCEHLLSINLPKNFQTVTGIDTPIDKVDDIASDIFSDGTNEDGERLKAIGLIKDYVSVPIDIIRGFLHVVLYNNRYSYFDLNAKKIISMFGFNNTDGFRQEDEILVCPCSNVKDKVFYIVPYEGEYYVCKQKKGTNDYTPIPKCETLSQYDKLMAEHKFQQPEKEK